MAQILNSAYSYITGSVSIGSFNHNSYAYTFAQGQSNYAVGYASSAQGKLNRSIGAYSHASGINTYSNGESSFSHGTYIIGDTNSGTAVGKYNGWTTQAQTTGHNINVVNHSYTDMLFEVGDGESHTTRHDAFAVGNNGNTYVFGDLYVDGQIVSVDQTATFTSNPINNYVTYSNGNQITSNEVKFISDVSINSAGALTYNQGKITYATGAVGGTANKGVISVNTATTKGVSATTKLGLTISDGIIKFTKIIDPIVCLTGSTILRPTATSQNITISVNNYTVATPVVNYSIAPSWSTKTSGTYTDLTAAADTDPSKSFTVPIAWSSPYKNHVKTITWTAPTVSQMGGTAKTITITISDPVPEATRKENDDDTKIGNSYTIYIRYPIFYATSDVFNVSANNTATQNLATVCGWCTGDGAIAGSPSAFTGGPNEGYVAIYSSSATKLVKYLWGTTANTSASRIRTITLFGVTYSVYKLSGSSANKLTITALA